MKHLVLLFLIFLACSAFAIAPIRDNGKNDDSRIIERKQTEKMIEGQKSVVIEKKENATIIKDEKISAQTTLQITMKRDQNRTRIQANLSNRKLFEIKVMPSVAAERAIERLRLKVCSSENNCTIELKEVGVKNETRATYSIRARKQARIFGIFAVEMPVEAEVDAENGEISKLSTPWWAFLTTDA